MGGVLVGRSAEIGVIRRFVGMASAGPAALVLEGEAGIGKTALLRAAMDLASQRSFTVLTCQPAAAEARFAYGALSDLLASIPRDLQRELPHPQRAALDAALLREGSTDRPPDSRAVSAACLALVEALARSSGVLVVVDDWQWLDRASEQALAFATRRFRGPVGVLAACRIALGGSDSSGERSESGVELRLPDGERPRRLAVGPLDADSLRRLLRAQREDLSGAMMERIAGLSGGNPLFAIGLASELPSSPLTVEVAMPASLQDLVRGRVRGLGSQVEEVLLLASALTRPTIALVRAALPGQDVEPLLEEAEERRIVRLEGGTISFTHPLLASGLYSAASASRRRKLHRVLATVVDCMEERARHMALGSVSATAEVMESLDRAARQARARGAPAAAAELLEMALALGAGTPERRVLAARMHFEAGTAGRAREMLEPLIDELEDGPQRARALGLLGTIRHHDDSFNEATELMKQGLDGLPPGSAEWIDLALELCWVLTNLACTSVALPYAVAACEAARDIGETALVAETLAVYVTLRFMLGHGLREDDLQEALALEDLERETLIWHRPSMLACLVFANVGRIDEAWAMLSAVRGTCAARGEDAELVFTVIHGVQLSLLRGRVDEARAFAEEGRAHAEILETGTATGIALWGQAALAGWEGREADARAAAEASLALFQENGSVSGALLALATLGQLELALGHSEAAAALLSPLALATVASAPADPASVPWTADAAEALIGLGRYAEAGTIADWLQRSGERLERSWALATGGRCRGMLLTAAGDFEGAAQSFAQALAAHERLGVEFERARTLLALAGLQRRARQRRAARETLREALDVFAQLGARVWAARASADLARVGAPRTCESDELTPAERRVALLAASGLTNRAAADKLFVSPKTVEATLARVYRKLGINSRAELGARVATLDGDGNAPRDAFAQSNGSA